MIRLTFALLTTLVSLALAPGASAVLVDWSAAATWHPSNQPFDRALVTSTGQTFRNVALTGLTAVVSGVGNGVPTPTLQGPLFNLQDNDFLTNPSITVAFSNGTADLRLTELANLQASEGQSVSNPDGIDMTVTQTALGGGLMILNGASVPGLGIPVASGAAASMTGNADVAGTSFEVEIPGTTGFTWAFASGFEMGSASHIQMEITASQVLPAVPALSAAGRFGVGVLVLLSGLAAFRATRHRDC